MSSDDRDALIAGSLVFNVNENQVMMIGDAADTYVSVGSPILQFHDDGDVVSLDCSECGEEYSYVYSSTENNSLILGLCARCSVKKVVETYPQEFVDPNSLSDVDVGYQTAETCNHS